MRAFCLAVIALAETLSAQWTEEPDDCRVLSWIEQVAVHRENVAAIRARDVSVTPQKCWRHRSGRNFECGEDELPDHQREDDGREYRLDVLAQGVCAMYAELLRSCA